MYIVSFCGFFWKIKCFKKRATIFFTITTVHLIDVNINNLHESKVCSKGITLNDIISQKFGYLNVSCWIITFWSG